MINMTIDDFYYNIKVENMSLITVNDKDNYTYNVLIIKNKFKGMDEGIFYRIPHAHYKEIIKLDRELTEEEFKFLTIDIYNIRKCSFEDFKSEVIKGKIKVIGRYNDKPDQISFLTYDFWEQKYDPDRNGPDDIRTEDLKYIGLGAILDRYITDEQINELKSLYKERV